MFQKKKGRHAFSLQKGIFKPETTARREMTSTKQMWCDMADNSEHICSTAGKHLCQVLYCLPQKILVFVSGKLLFLQIAQNLRSFIGRLPPPHRCNWHFVRIIRLHPPKLISSHPDRPSHSALTRGRQELPHLLDVHLNITLIQRDDKVLQY